MWFVFGHLFSSISGLRLQPEQAFFHTSANPYITATELVRFTQRRAPDLWTTILPRVVSKLQLDLRQAQLRYLRESILESDTGVVRPVFAVFVKRLALLAEVELKKATDDAPRIEAEKKKE